MGRELVIKYNGVSSFRDKCRKLNGQWYEKNVDCFKVDGRWARVDSGYIFYDYSTNKWRRFSNTPRVLEGYVDKDKIGYFTKTIFTVRCVEGLNKLCALNHDVAIANGFIDKLSDNYYYKNLSINKKGISDSYGEIFYTAAQTLDKSSLLHQENYSPRVPFNIRKLARFIKGYSAGFEFETSTGYIKKWQLHKHGFIPLKDGSLRDEHGELNSFEYTSVPLRGAAGIYNVMEFSDILKQRCKHDIRCSLHIHVGGYKPSKLNVVVLYYVIQQIQDEMLEMLPHYKTDPAGHKKENYCKKLPHIVDTVTNYPKDDFEEIVDDNFISIFKFASMGYAPDDRFNLATIKHPTGRRKWDISSRKHIVNFVSLIFSASNTVEFRAMNATFSKHKIIYWLFICIAILKYADKEGVRVLKRKSITLSDILQVYNVGSFGGFLTNALISFVKERKETFTEALKNGDRTGEADEVNDFDYKPDYDILE